MPYLLFTSATRKPIQYYSICRYYSATIINCYVDDIASGKAMAPVPAFTSLISEVNPPSGMLGFSAIINLHAAYQAFISSV